MEYLLVFFAFFLSSVVHSTTGFGSALVGMPILVFAVGLSVSAPLLALLSQVVNLGVLWQNWRYLDWRHSLILIIPSILGVPIGLLFLKGGNEKWLNLGLGLILLGFGLFTLVKGEHQSSPKSDKSALIFGSLAGFIAGILGGAYNANGPPVIMYGTYFQLGKGTFRSVLQAFFLINGFVILAGHIGTGLMTLEVLKYSLVGLPAMILGMGVGFYIDKYLTPKRFRLVVLIGIILLGCCLILPSLLDWIKGM